MARICPRPVMTRSGLRTRSDTDSVGNRRPPIIRSSRDLSYTFKQYAAFGEATWHFTDQWALTGGLRYYKFDEDRVLTFAGFFAAPTANVPGSTSSDGLSPRVILAYSPNDDMRVHGAGGTRLPAGWHQRSAERAAVLARRTWRRSAICRPGTMKPCGTTSWAPRCASPVVTSPSTPRSSTATSRICRTASMSAPAPRASWLTCLRLTVTASRPNSLRGPVLNWDFGISATWLNAELDSTITDAGTSTWSQASRKGPPADLARVPGRGERHV